MTDWAAESLTVAADAVASGRTSSRGLLEACLDRYDRLETSLHAFVELDRAAARKAADDADHHMKHYGPLGSLHGVPLAHKDMYYRKGRVSSCGSRTMHDVVARETATVLQRLDASGALEIGQLVMVEYALGPHGYNANYPACGNAWHPDYIPCGSSSGSGVAVAAGMAFASLGSDTGGSIRCPATANGIVGLLPTNGRVSRAGVMPMSFSLDVVGPLARTVRDCARILDVIAGADPRDPTALDAGVPGYEAILGTPRRKPVIGVARGFFDAAIDSGLARLMDDAERTFASLGFEVRDVAMPVSDLEAVSELHPLVMKSEGAANHMNVMRARPDDYTLEVYNRLQAGFFIPACDYIQALKLRADFHASFVAKAFTDVDLLLTPAMRGPVPSRRATTGLQGKDYLNMVTALTQNTKVANYLGLPAITVPCGFTDNGLPAAIQLIGPALAEPDLLHAAHVYERATTWHTVTPTFVAGTLQQASPEAAKLHDVSTANGVS